MRSPFLPRSITPRLLTLSLAMATLLAVVAPVPATAAASVTTTGSCIDGGEVTWQTKVVWGAKYRQAGADRVSVRVAGWTTEANRVPTDSTVTTYSNGVLGQQLTRTATVDYQLGKTYGYRNPANPLSVPGRTKVTITVGKDGDGKADCTVTHVQPSPVEPTVTKTLGKTKSGLAWHSGAWLGGRFDAANAAKFGSWRGSSADMMTTYSPRNNYQTIANDSWSISTWKGFPGRLNYGLTMLPDDGAGSFASIADGKQDAVWRAVARNLSANGRGNSIVRVGWEANLRDWRWNVNTANAGQFKAAYRRIVQTMRREAPDLVFDFGIGCGSGLKGSTDRLAPLTLAYPGDDVVDIVGCDVYDWWTTHATSDASWGNVLHPNSGPGIQDVVTFARKHGKTASFPEWGLAKSTGGNNAGGDNPYFVKAMFEFFSANRSTVAYEAYFDEPDTYIRSSLFGARQNPKASAVYRRLW